MLANALIDALIVLHALIK